jgi:hypothetical protein
MIQNITKLTVYSPQNPIGSRRSKPNMVGYWNHLVLVSFLEELIRFGQAQRYVPPVNDRNDPSYS